MFRADEFLVQNGFVESRSKARSLIEEGKVLCNGLKIDKPSRKIPDGAKISVEEGAFTLKYVSRAGHKLEGALAAFGLDVEGLTVLDAGASTGGFTDCMLSRGAKRVFCVDVGTGQLHPKILSDPRAVDVPQTDVRSLSADFFYGKFPDDFADKSKEPFDFVAADLSFISIEKVFDGLWNLLRRGGRAVFLIKPQFEAGIDAIKKGRGVVREKSDAVAAAEKIRNHISASFPDAKVLGLIDSPILGGDGNAEFLIGLEKLRV